MPGRYTICAYYFPDYHVDPRNERVHGHDWTEWELMRRAEPRFPGHRQPRVPLWGYEDESDPRVFARKIDAAADHGIDCFLFNWYWYDEKPFLARALESGYLRALNSERVSFAIHWSNNDWLNVHPAKCGCPSSVVYPGTVDEKTFERITNYMIQRYFPDPRYWRIDGAPFVAIGDIRFLVSGLGGPRAAREALKGFRERVARAGFPDLHLNTTWKGIRPADGRKTRARPSQVLKAMGIDSVTSYTWTDDIELPEFPQTDYERVAKQAAASWKTVQTACKTGFFPNVTMGWDPSPRTVQSDRFMRGEYPFSPTFRGNTPERFKTALGRAKSFVDRQKGSRRIITVNAWNEWTNGSYLEPDTLNGNAYLEAIRDTFMKKGGTKVARTTNLRNTRELASGE